MIYNSVTGKNWKLKDVDFNKVLHYQENLEISEILSRLLILRNIKIDEVETFLDPKISKNLPDPNILKDMEKSVDFTYEQIKNKKIIGIFGDYDVDGASATALLINFFSNIKQAYKSFIPDRKKDGYGPSINTFKKLCKEKMSLIITVDCGTLSYESIDFANKKNIKTIVLDHHQADIKLPKALGIINPNRLDDKSKLNYLCAAAVTFLFIVGLNRKLKKEKWYENNNIVEPNIKNYLDLVALGTVCDVVPLIGLNRVFVKIGLKILEKKENIGLKTLSEICNVETQPDVSLLGFIFGPRINAGGRLGFSSYGAELLSTKNIDEAKKISIKLNELNNNRKKIQDNHFNEILKQAKDNKKDPVLILYKPEWHEGIIGILASKIKDQFLKPTIILTGLTNSLKASARSIHGFDIGNVISNAIKEKIILKGGGHKMAGGFIIQKDNLNKLKLYINKCFIKTMGHQINSGVLFDAIISPSALNEEFYNEVNLMSPFGNANANPNFVLENMTILKSKILKEKHISSILLTKNRKSIKSICFNAINTKLEPYLTNTKFNLNILGKLSLNIWKGRRQIQFIIDDLSLN